MSDLARHLVAEGFGTGLLVCAVIGSGIMADRLTGDGALALLVNTGATTAVPYVLITLFGPVSGAQFNRVVALVMRLRNEMTTGTATADAAVQVPGEVAGAACFSGIPDAARRLGAGAVEGRGDVRADRGDPRGVARARRPFDGCRDGLCRCGLPVSPPRPALPIRP